MSAGSVACEAIPSNNGVESNSSSSGRIMSIDFDSSVFSPSPVLPIRTPVDLAARFGDIPLERFRFDPQPGSATEEDVNRIRDQEKRLFELVDGTLIEKAMGAYESLIAVRLSTAFMNYLEKNPIGIVLGADGMLRLRLNLVRIPDVAFISKARLTKGRFPRRGVAPMAPDLAIEVISQNNTVAEMEQKLDEYFAAGVSEVWYFYPDTQETRVYRARTSFTLLTSHDALASPLLPGFSCPIAPLFAHPDEMFGE